MTTRAKMKLDSYTTTNYMNYKKEPRVMEEMRTLHFSVVSSGSPENDSFFGSTPSGKIELSTVSKEAWAMFELGKEYYVDFTSAS